MLRWLLVLVLLVAAFQVQDRYRDKAEAAHGIETTKARLQVTQREVTTVQQELEPLRTQISQLQQQREARKQAAQAYQGVTSGLERWHAALSPLFGPEAPGVRFESVTTRTGGEVVLKGVVTEREAVAKLQTQFKDVAAILDLQSIEWKAGGTAFTFTAAFKVRR
jgi:Tfp pilus assembly protein PilN